MSESEFDRLGAREFESLCQALLVHHHGAAIEVRRGPGDRGADALATRSLCFPDPSRRARGPFVFQVKFVENAMELGDRAVTQLCKSLRAERDAIGRRTRGDTWAKPRHYVVMTNVRVSPSRAERVRDAISPAVPDANVHVLDRRWLDAALDGAPEIRRSFPALLSVADLEAIINGVVARPLRTRSQSFLKVARDLHPTFVTTRTYGRAVAMVETHSFVVLTGSPEMGKTAIAMLLALVHADEGWDVIDCEGRRTSSRPSTSDGGRCSSSTTCSAARSISLHGPRRGNGVCHA